MMGSMKTIDFAFRTALVRPLAPSFAAASLRSADPEIPIDMALAHRQHEKYVSALRSVLGLSVVSLPALPDYPDSVFVEDSAVVLGARCLLTRPGAASRRGEVPPMATAMERHAPGLTLIRPGPGDGDAFLDGGDVLRTSRHVFVGVSSRTNAAGVDMLRRASPLPVHAVSFGGAALHLKSVATMCGPSSVVYADTDAGRAARKAMTNVEGGLQWYPVSEERAANCIYANGAIIYPAGIKGEDEATYTEMLEKVVGLRAVVQVDIGEMAKSDGALTCCSILLP